MAVALDHRETYTKSLLPFLDRTRTIARPGYNRWLVPPAALCVHLCIGQAYAFSVFNLPLTKLLGIIAIGARTTGSSPTSAGSSASRSSSSACRRPCSATGWRRPGRARRCSPPACCCGGGFLVSALGVYTHQLWLLYLGYGVLGGIGLGLGYISPVSTLIKWFPDRPGMATGMAIMGFGGGAMIASPLSVWLMSHFAHRNVRRRVGDLRRDGRASISVFMMFGAFIVRVPPPGWKPAGYVPPASRDQADHARTTSTATRRVKTPQFWLLWVVLFLNVTAGIGVLGQASPMIQEMFPGTSRRRGRGFRRPAEPLQHGRPLLLVVAVRLHRPQEHLLRLLPARLRALRPGALAGRDRQRGAVRRAASCIIMSMYGGGFATIPAYLRDMFGTQYVGAIHGRLLTAWSAAGIARPGAGELHPRVPDRRTACRRRRPTTSRCTSWPGCW